MRSQKEDISPETTAEEVIKSTVKVIFSAKEKTTTGLDSDKEAIS